MKTVDEMRDLITQKHDVKVKRHTGTMPFLRGTLDTWIVEKPDGAEWKIWVWQDSLGLKYRDFDTTDSLISFISMSKNFIDRPSTIDKLTTVNFVSAFIALVLILCIALLIVRGDADKIPPILGNALTVILGFYFGKAAGERRINA